MPLSALLILTNGFEEVEAITPIDLLRRANINLLTASRETSNKVTGAHNISIETDTSLKEALNQEYDALILPGGPGYKSLQKDNTILETIRNYHTQQKTIGAICAAPVVLKEAGILNDQKITAHFSVQNELSHIQKDKLVVVDQNLVTGNGPGAAVAFSLALIKKLIDEQTAKAIAQGIGLGIIEIA